MALASAVAALQLLARKGARLRVLIVSDSQYLVKGMREWVPGWAARGWRRKEGPIENLELWKALVASARLHDVQWTWVRGTRDTPRTSTPTISRCWRRRSSERPKDRAVGIRRVARRQASEGLYLAYDPDAAFAELEERLAADEPVRAGASRSPA